MPKLIDLTGQKFGRWTVLEYDKNWRKNGGTGGAAWICKCKCGTIKSIRGIELRKGRSKSCGCLQKKDRTGQRFGKLVVLKKDPQNYNKYICQCDCGNIISVYQGHLTQGFTKSCNKNQCAMRDKNSIIGQKFGKLIVIKRDLSRKGDNYWLCNCDCGTKNKSVSKKHLIKGYVKSCGCSGFHSLGEEQIESLLKKYKIPYKREYIFPDFFYKDTHKHPRYDFFVDNKYLIEFDGRQHFKVGGWTKTEEDLQKLQQKDEIKNNYAKQHNIPLIRIPYTHLNKIKLEDIQLETSSFII